MYWMFPDLILLSNQIGLAGSIDGQLSPIFECPKAEDGQ